MWRGRNGIHECRQPEKQGHNPYKRDASYAQHRGTGAGAGRFARECVSGRDDDEHEKKMWKPDTKPACNAVRAAYRPYWNTAKKRAEHGSGYFRPSSHVPPEPCSYEPCTFLNWNIGCFSRRRACKTPRVEGDGADLRASPKPHLLRMVAKFI
jgi:hypothetical protein